MADDETYRELATKLVHAGEPRVDGAVRLPIFQTAMFEYAGDDPRGARYIRYFNTPNQVALSEKLAALEGAEAGVVTSSGMAAVSAVMLTLLRPGDHMLAIDSLYGGTHEIVTGMLPGFDVSHTFIDGGRPETWHQQLRPNTKLVYAETITNPLVRVPDHEALVAFCKEHGLTSVIDNTFASPINFRPAQRSYDISLHSMTKYLNGHSDVVAGCVLGSEEAIGRVRHTLLSLGSALDPHAAFLVTRGLNTLALRVAHQNAAALDIARFLEGHPRVARVSYPGLESHPDHARAKAQLDGFGGMLAFEPEGGLEGAEAFIAALTIPIVAPSLGGPETLVTRPAITSHVGLSADERAALGITDGLIRCSVGLEDPKELKEDFAKALGIARVSPIHGDAWMPNDPRMKKKAKSLKPPRALAVAIALAALGPTPAAYAEPDPEAERTYRQCARGCLPMAIKQLRHVPRDELSAVITGVCVENCKAKADQSGLAPEDQTRLMAETLDAIPKPPYWGEAAE